MPVRGKAGRPKILLVDDDAPARASLARRLQRNGYQVIACPGYEQALTKFRAGLVDAVVADWDLAPSAQRKGDALFSAIRDKDWEVPLVLVSGKLQEDHQRAETFRILLNQGSVRFVERGSGYAPVLDALKDLLSRRDIALVTLIKTLRGTRGSIRTTAGRRDGKGLLKDLLSDQENAKMGGVSTIAEEFAKWEAEQLGQLRQPS